MSSVTLFEKSGYTGRSVALTPGTHRLADLNFDDIASSIQVPPGMVALVFEHWEANKNGGYDGYGLNADFLEYCADLSVYYLNDKISFVSVFPVRDGSGQVWVRSRILNGVYWAGRWEEEQAPGTAHNPHVPTISPPVLPHILEISRADGKPWVNPPFDTSNPDWASNVVGGKRFDAGNDHPFEWVSVLNPTIEQDDQIGVSGTVIAPDFSNIDLPFTHPFGAYNGHENDDSDPGNPIDFEFSIAPDPTYNSLLGAANRDPKGQYQQSWDLAHQLGIDGPGFLGLEIDAGLVPEPDQPRHADRVATYGRWIVDAGHPDFHTEIHPPLLMAYARCVNTSGFPAAPNPGAITHVQFWSRPYQSAQRFKTGNASNLSLHDYIVDTGIDTTSRIHAYPPIHAKPFAGVHLVAFTVRPPVALNSKPSVLDGTHPPQWQLQCSYHFTVNGSCGVEVQTTLAGPNAVLVQFALTDAAYPSLPEPSSKELGLSVKALVEAAKDVLSETDADVLKLAGWAHSDLALFRIYSALATSRQDSVNVVPFTPLNILPASEVAIDPNTPFPVRGWLKLAWVGLTSTS